MATVEKKPRKLPNIPQKESSKDEGQKDEGKGRGKGRGGAAAPSKDPPPPSRKRELPPVKPAGRRVRDTKSMVEMSRQSPVEVSNRTSLTATNNAKSCFFYIDNDYTFPPLKMVIHPKKYKRLETVTRDLSTRMKALPFGVRSIYTPRGQHRVHNLEDLTQDGHYICSSNRKFAKGMDVARVSTNRVWHNIRPDSGRKNLNQLLKDIELRSAKNRAGFRPGYDLSNIYSRVPPKKTTVMKNGEPDTKHVVLLNRRTAQTFEQVLKTLSDLFQFAIRKLYTIEGVLIDGLQKMMTGPDVIVAAGLEPFINLSMDYQAQKRTKSRMDTSMGSRLNIQTRMQTRRDRLSKTKGHWIVTTRTNALPSAGTQAQVTITVYGAKGNSGAMTLGHGDGTNFQPGQEDEFEIQVGNVGEIYKIRLAHDNSGDFPGWLCDEVKMRDVNTGEELSFSCRRWLARDEDDQEITRELAVKRPGEPILPLIKYQVDVITGDVWGGGTDANVYITIYGDRGDTGVRQLYADTKGVYFKQGQIDSFEVEAVSLGHLKRIIIGHDGTGPGAGWFLDKVVIREPPFRTNQECVFHCGKWLDEGEDDGKIVRELRIQDEYMDDILEKRHWEFEKWKYEQDGQVIFFSMMTGKAMRLNRDLSVDGIGEERDKYAVFDVHPKKSMRPMFSSAATANHYLAIDNGRITGLGKGGPYCEFRVRVQQDRTTMFESVKNPLQFLTIGADGLPGEVRGILDKEPARRFHVYAKGCFRHKGVVMLCTSLLQSINVNTNDMTLTGRGKRGGPQSQFRVHKVNTGGIRMFESVAHPGKFIRLRDGKIDCNRLDFEGGKSEESHFLVLRHKDKGYITLQSAGQRGLFIGMTADGRVHTTIDTGVRNIWLYPEVIEWGMKKIDSTDMVEEQVLRSVDRDLVPQRQPEPELEPEPTPTPEPPAKQFADDRTDSIHSALAEQIQEIPDQTVPLVVEDGDWSIHVSTLTDMADGDVALIAYGDKGNSGPIVLGAPPGRKIFQEGNEDEFRANLLKIGKMFKIRLELIPKVSTRNPSWQVKEVRMQDLNTEETLKFNFSRWLSREEDDGEIMREMAVSRPGESSLPLRHYIVNVYTGKEMGAETDAPVYITAHGEHGDWGKRYLVHSNNNKKFRTGQVDVFYIEAVSLGDLQRCVIGHDGTGAGEGWYLEQVVIREDENSPDEFVFPCNRWLDSGMEDRRIERALMVKDKKKAEEIKEEIKDGKYELEMVTGPESDPLSSSGRVQIVLYGDSSEPVTHDLYSTDPAKKVFEPGNIDKFTIPLGDLGELYKIRIGRDDTDKWKRWFLSEVRLTDPRSKVPMVFSFNRWLARDLDDGDMCRELPVMRVGKHIPLLLQYQVEIVTGDHWAASTDANMYITLYGSRGDSGRRLLHNCTNNRVKFQRGQVDIFKLEIVDLDTLSHLTLSHDGRGHGAGVFIDKVVVSETDTERSHMLHVFPCGRWLDTHEDDFSTERTLNMIDVIDTKKPAPPKENKKSNGNWTVTVKTSSGDRTATTARAHVTVYGTNGCSGKLPLTSADTAANSFTPGAESQFQILTGDIGRVTKIRLEHDNSGAQPDWKVNYVNLCDVDTGEDLMFYVDRWLAIDKDDGSICRELPVVRKGSPSLPVLRYVIAVTTGSYKDAGIEGCMVKVNLIGPDGDTGLQELAGAVSKHRQLWQPGQTDIFILESVSVGKIKKIELNYTNKEQERWHVQQVAVSEGSRSPTQFVSYCNQWILPSDSQITELQISEVQPSSLVDLFDSIPKGLEKPVRSKGRWLVLASTGTENEAGTKEKINIVLCGLKGESPPVILNSKDDLNPGSIVKQEVKAVNVGLLFKVRLFFHDKHPGSTWYLAKMKLKDQDTGEEFILEHNDWIESTNECPEGVCEIALPRPDLAPLKEQVYIVSVKTGILPRSETDASVFCNLIGQWGSSGQRSLAVSSNKELFRQGQVDEFTVTCIDLGKLQKVTLGHDLVGRGQGWYCEEVVVKVAELEENVFPCNRWLDTGCDDRQLTTDLLPVAHIPFSYYLPTRYTQSDGEWNIHVTTASADCLPTVKQGDKAGDISVVVYGSEGVRGPLDLTLPHADAPIMLLAPGKTEHFHNIDLSGVGEIEKIRVSSGYEGDTASVWTIDQVVLEDVTSGESLTFSFRQWAGQVGGDIRKEMPLIHRDKPFSPVIKYYLEVYTSEEEMSASTNANIFITLYGANSDSGRRHLLHSKNTNKRFQAGEVDLFEIEAVNLGYLEKLVVAKGPGKPWLLEKIIVKRGQFAADEHVFMFGGWIGDKTSQQVEVEETLKLTATIPSHVAIPLAEAKHIQPSAGSWVLDSVTGGRRGPDKPLDAVVVFCGQEGETPALPLVSNKQKPFEIGLPDTFKVKYSEKIGDLRKVRFGFTDLTVAKAWYIRKVTFEDEDSKDTFCIEVNDWVAIDNKLDGWKELPVPWPAITVPKVIKYSISVHLGQVNPDSHNNQVYICLHGDQGSSGRRLLKHSSSNTEKFRSRQTDVFEVEAVYLGDLVKIVIGHSNVEKGGGWYLEKVVVRESPDESPVVFQCNKWLDAGEEDGQIERTLTPSESNGDENLNNNAAPPEVIVPLVLIKPDRELTLEQEPVNQRETTPEPAKEPTPEKAPTPQRETTPDVKPVIEEAEENQSVPPPALTGSKYTVTVSTGSKEGQGTDKPLELVFYGNKGHSGPLVIGDQEGFTFSEGNTDLFEVSVPDDIGELFKVRLGFHGEEQHPEWYSDLDHTPSWFLQKLTVRQEADGIEYSFPEGMRLKVETYQDFWRELPVIKEPQLNVYQYQVAVYTGSESKAGTEANVYLQIFGECGDTGYRRLMSSKTNLNKFEQGMRDVFEIGAVDLGKLTQVKIRHNGSGPGSGWLLDRVVVKETMETTIRYVFKYERWLDEGNGETAIEQTLSLSEILVSDEEEDPQKQNLPGFGWTVETWTGSDESDGCSYPVELVLYEADGQAQSFVIGDREGFTFIPGAKDSFNIRLLSKLGGLYKVRIGYLVEPSIDWYQNYQHAPTWCLNKLELTNDSSGEVFSVETGTLLQVDGTQDFWREKPFLQPDGSLPDVYNYCVELYTGAQSKAGTNATVQLSIHGNKGDTGFRRLMASKNNKSKFEPGQCDVFEISAVDLGDLEKVKVTHDGAGLGSGWHLEKVVVRESEDSTRRYVFTCDNWLNVGEGEKLVTMTIPLSDVLETAKKQPLTGAPWTVWCVTGEGDEGLDSPVELVLYGDRGHSDPVILGAEDGFVFTPGQVDVFEVGVEGDVGRLYKVRVGFHGDRHTAPWSKNYHLAPSWVLESLKLRDETSGTEYETEAGVLIQTERHMDFWRELPVINTENSLPVHTYLVEVHSGARFEQGSDVAVYIQLYGDRGDSGLRRLMDSKTNSEKFAGKQVDVFEVPAVDLGQLFKVKVTHNGKGQGSDWLLERVVVRAGEDSRTQYVFECPEGLEEGSGVEDVTVELLLTDTLDYLLPLEPEPLAPKGTFKGGDCTVKVVTSGETDSGTDSNVTLTVYGDADNTGPIPLGNHSTGYFYSGKTDEFDVFLDPEVIGQIRKIRLEHDNSGKPWQVDKVVLVSKTDGAQLEFPIYKWLSLEQPGFDIAVEVPVSGHDWPVREYVVCTLTGDGFGSGTDADVYVKLIGTIGDTGKRFLVHNLEKTEPKFDSGQLSTFLVQAVDVGRLVQVQIGHNGTGPGSGWYLKQVAVREGLDSSETYIFKCDKWLHDEKDDHLTERLLNLDHVEKTHKPLSVITAGTAKQADKPERPILEAHSDVQSAPRQDDGGDDEEDTDSVAESVPLPGELLEDSVAELNEPKGQPDGRKRPVSADDRDGDEQDVKPREEQVETESDGAEGEGQDVPKELGKGNTGEPTEGLEAESLSAKPGTPGTKATNDKLDKTRVSSSARDRKSGQDEGSGQKPVSREGSLTYRVNKED